MHRAVVNAKKDRYSTIYFYGIDNSVTLTVPPELVSAERPLKYRPFTVTEHRKYIVDNEVPVNAVRHLQIDPEASWPSGAADELELGAELYNRTGTANG